MRAMLVEMVERGSERMSVYIIPFVCFLATYFLGIVIGRQTVKMDMKKERGNGNK